ncbi:SRPBCC domain-containing protein [Paenibacillus chitinolyticus]|uniref:SRPBCC family protein n=1 Tax=Paenibacillus chitinolyticus TaxID=79263 RepID=UPI002DBE4DE1|nr:SRPBCC domain-containing protein [Paenibacillus chitinolyticus]MEC0245452.1 SRPBCC domain-containing protein [Paenibacillus chitinolyticus]
MSQNTNKQELVITRVFDIPVEWVWKGWTDPKLVPLWWGPAHYTSPRSEIDLRVGGKYLFCMQAPQEQGGQIFYNTGVYTKIVTNERLEFTQSLSDADGNPIDPADVGMPSDFPKEVKFVIEFKALGDARTELTITERGWSPGQMSKYAVMGMNQSLDKFAVSIGQLIV